MNNGLYGNMLSYFQGQFIELEYFDMQPLVNAGYDTSKTRDDGSSRTTGFRGCFQNMLGNEAKDSNGHITFVLTGDLWSYDKLLLGKFVKVPNEEAVYRIKKEKGWNREGGFYYYSVVQVVGDDGQITTDVIFDKGEEKFV